MATTRLEQVEKRIAHLQKELEDLNIVRREIARKMDESFDELKELTEERRVLETWDRICSGSTGQ